MRLLYIVQRYGRDIAGGAEQFCRQMASRMAARGHHVEVVTSCAVSYADWANVLPIGDELIDGVLVHRLPVERPRDNHVFGALNARVVAGSKPVPLYLQREWMRQQGPEVAGIDTWIEANAERFDAAIACTYLYYTTWKALPVASAMLPTVLHPTAHDEPPIYLPLFDLMMRLPHAFGFLTEEEAGLVRRRFRVLRPSTVTGIGVELDASGDGAGFRSRHDLGDAPYLVYVGRIDPHKGAAELVDQFRTYKSRNRGPLKLVMVGDEVWPVPEDPDIVVTGFVSEQEKRDAIDGSLALVHPSYFESFSMALSEAWAQGKPALVQGRCEVLVGQATRSGGALPYRGFAEFEDALKVFEDDHLLVSRLARAGQRYVERRYRWDTVLTRYERFLDRTVDRATPRLTGQRASEMS